MQIRLAILILALLIPAPLTAWQDAGQARLTVEGDLVVPIEQAPDDLREGMGESWRIREENRKVLEATNR